jgi:hypothetical protein
MFVIGATPPLLAGIVEFLNPISQQIVKTQSSQVVESYIGNRIRGRKQSEQLVDQISSAIVKTVFGAIEISALIPTWIGITAAITATAVEIAEPIWCSIILFFWTAISGIVGFRFFPHVNYYNMGDRSTSMRICRGAVYAKCLSIFLILSNFFAIAVVGAISFLR